MRSPGPKVKLSRRLGVALTPKAAKIMERKPYAPGQHGPTVRRQNKLSDYKRQLLEKQKLRAQYNVRESQMRRYVERAARMKGSNTDNLIAQLETRLELLVLRAGFARTIYQARQIVSHRHILLNGLRVSIPSMNVRPGDVISVREGSRTSSIFAGLADAVKTSAVFAHISVDAAAMKATLLSIPKRADAPIICEVASVIEFYSR
jgi:small subunit ribosomal protein S4